MNMNLDENHFRWNKGNGSSQLALSNSPQMNMLLTWDEEKMLTRLLRIAADGEYWGNNSTSSSKHLRNFSDVSLITLNYQWIITKTHSVLNETSVISWHQ